MTWLLIQRISKSNFMNKYINGKSVKCLYHVKFTITFLNIDFNIAPLYASWGDATKGKGPKYWETSMEVQYLLWISQINKERKLFMVYIQNCAIKSRYLLHLVSCIDVHILCSIFCRTFVPKPLQSVWRSNIRQINKEGKCAIKTRYLLHLVRCIYVHILCSIFCRTFLQSILASCNVIYQTRPWSMCYARETKVGLSL